MRWLLAFLFLHGVLGLNILGKPVLQGSELCRPWTTLNAKLFRGEESPSLKAATDAIKALLPEGDWQTVAEDAVGACYAPVKPRTYTNTCPGQALLHCVVDHLISHCPESAVKKDDSCAPLSSLAGFKYMFSQSRYEDMEKYLPTERRPLWFLKNYFSSKCCDVPQLFSAKVLSESGFTSMIHYYDHEHKPKGPHVAKAFPAMIVTTEAHVADKVRVVDHADEVRVVDQSPEQSDDPLDCCNLSEFISLESRSSCKFQTTWSESRRLEVLERKLEDVVTTTRTPEASPKHHDVRVVPLSCDKENCVFRSLNIVSESGSVDTSAFSRLLDNLTSEHPEWRKAKARVVTRCLTRPIKDYEGECEINKVLACTFDILSENCPHAKKPTVNPCKHTYSMKNDTICQINSSKFRPKNRRPYCDFPRFVSHEVLSTCGMSSISQVEKAEPPVLARAPRRLGWIIYKPVCNESKPATNCVLSKMGVLNKYNFLDYFKMKDRIRQFISDNVEWRGLSDVYVATMTGMPMYRESCAGQRKLLNVVDAMLMTCPASRRKNTEKCNKMFREMIKRGPDAQQAKMEETLLHDFMTLAKTSETPFGRLAQKPKSLLEQMPFGADYLPPVRIMHIKPQRMVTSTSDPNAIQIKRPLVITPVYMGMVPSTTPLSTTSQYLLPREYLRTETLYNPPFKHDGTFTSAAGPKRVPNGHKGPVYMFGFPNLP